MIIFLKNMFTLNMLNVFYQRALIVYILVYIAAIFYTFAFHSYKFFGKLRYGIVVLEF